MRYSIKKYFLILIFLFFIFFSLFINSQVIRSQSDIIILDSSRQKYQKAFKFKYNYYIVEYFFKENLEYLVAKYYINEFLLPVFLKKGFKEVKIEDVVRIPKIKMADMMPKTINFKIFKELYYDIIDIGSLSYNYQILVVFSKRFNDHYLLRLFEFKFFNIEHNPPNFISGGVYLKITDNEFKILKEF